MTPLRAPQKSKNKKSSKKKQYYKVKKTNKNNNLVIGQFGLSKTNLVIQSLNMIGNLGKYIIFLKYTFMLFFARVPFIKPYQNPFYKFT